MSLAASVIRFAEQAPLPDPVTKFGVSFLVGRTSAHLARLDSSSERKFANAMLNAPIAEHTNAANQQHYELPPEFFAATLGPRRKYSCCLYPTGKETLAEAELLALRQTCERAALADGQRILELGCGWGSLSLYMAEHYPNARITAVSNSAPQRRYIESEASKRGFDNLTVITVDMNIFAQPGHYDRVVSIEMFEHMSNWSALLSRINTWLKPDGRLFIHVFAHQSQPYHFDHGEQADWIAQHFFTGGIMPSHGLMAMASDSFNIENEWQWSGIHYQRTAMDWLANFDRNIALIDPILHRVYGLDAPLWRRRWRLFYLATAGLFGHKHGREWGVSHYLLQPIHGEAAR